MGRLAALVLSLVAIGVMTAVLGWLVFTMVGAARRAYERYKSGFSK